MCFCVCCGSTEDLCVFCMNDVNENKLFFHGYMVSLNSPQMSGRNVL